ncbi:MAG TPA: PepSY domain-containing protein [Candidatus Caccomorpha excrementavium]|nr:PepSY domain-containing protein [Candidatus Caccomorpha excrementavium]
MKRNRYLIVSVALLIMMLSGCGSPEPSSDSSLPSGTQTTLETVSPAETETASAAQETTTAEEVTEQTTQETTTQAPVGSSEPSEAAQSSSGSDSDAVSASDIDRDAALAIAMENAGVTENDIYNVKVERDRTDGISVFDIEFETDYGDYDFEVAVSDGTIVGADYEVNEEWLGRLGGSPVTMEEAKSIIQDKVPGASADDIRIWEERDDGRVRYEGELFHDEMKYEFEIDPETGIIFDWNADLRS